MNLSKNSNVEGDLGIYDWLVYFSTGKMTEMWQIKSHVVAKQRYKKCSLFEQLFFYLFLFSKVEFCEQGMKVKK